jgi:uncharacterized caspase-like protein
MVRLAFALLLILTAPALAAGKRVALVVGNSAYEEAGPLANPVNDARDMADALRAIGFTVIEGTDLGKRALERKVGEFADALTGAEVGMFFYAGHGIQVDGRNFLLPTDARLDVPAKLKLEAVPIDDVIDIIESQATISLVFLDACRNNPFPKNAGNRGAASMAAGLGNGLAQFDASRGSFIAFSTAPGAVALDGAGRNSPFASALLRHIGTPAQGIGDMMIAVRNDVMAETKGTQRPWDQSALTARFEFVPAGGGDTAAQSAPAGTVAVAAAPAAGNGAVRALDSRQSIETLVRQYLAPDVSDLPGTVEELYAPVANLFGADYDQQGIARIKGQWFAYYKSWQLELVPDTLQVVMAGERDAQAVFAMRYDYEPVDATQPRQAGTTKVLLSLTLTDRGWRIVREGALQ